MTITTKAITNVEVTKQDKDFLKAYYKKALSMAIDVLEDDNLKDIFRPGFEDGKFAYKFDGGYLLHHFKYYLSDGIFENYESYEIKWNENGENKSLIIDEETFGGEDDLFEFLRDCCYLSIDEEVYNEILLPIIKEQTELLLKKTGVILDFDYTNEFKYSVWR